MLFLACVGKNCNKLDILTASTDCMLGMLPDLHRTNEQILISFNPDDLSFNHGKGVS